MATAGGMVPEVDVSVVVQQEAVEILPPTEAEDVCFGVCLVVLVGSDVIEAL